MTLQITNAGTIRITIPVSIVRIESVMAGRRSVKPQVQEPQGVGPHVIEHHQGE
jgi:hypothetical protein